LNKNLLILSTGHFLADFAVGFFPIYIVLAGLNLKTAGLVAAITSFLANLSHPFFGWIADRTAGKRFFVISLLCTTFFMSLLGLSRGNMGILFLLLLLGKLGNAAFHPLGSRLAGAEGHRTRSFSLFVVWGTAGFALSQFSFERLVTAYGMESTPLLFLLGLLFGVLYIAKGPETRPPNKTESSQDLRAALREHRPTILKLYVLVVLRAAVQVALIFSLPTLFKMWGFPQWSWGLGTFFYLGFGALGMLALAFWGANWNPRRVMVLGMLFTAPLLFLLILLGHKGLSAVIPLLAILSFCTYSVQPVNVTLGQRLMPDHAATISGILMGFAWALGALSTLFLGWFSTLRYDWFGGGLLPGLLLLGMLPFGGTVVALMLPREEVTEDGSRRN